VTTDYAIGNCDYCGALDVMVTLFDGGRFAWCDTCRAGRSDHIEVIERERVTDRAEDA
jgi:hypothetical protein